MAGLIAAVVVAGGSGSRAGGAIPKQFQQLGPRPVYAWSVEACRSSPLIGGIALVVPPAHLDEISSQYRDNDDISVVPGGADRSASVHAGLKALQATSPEKVLIHDAARPGLTPAMIATLCDALSEADAAAPALPAADSLRRTGQTGCEPLDRTGIVRVQTPQAFHFTTILAAHEQKTQSASDDLGMLPPDATIKLIPGDHRLMKITTPEDMEKAARLLLDPDIRSGSGYDVHAFTEGDHVTLCGVRIPHDRALSGHSDADAGWHALTDAILGALALGDIGDHFPPSDPKWKGADSAVFLAHAAKLAAERNYRITNADITLICEAPRIGPHREAMRQRTAEVLAIPIDRVSVKATTTEKLGFTGRKEGLAAQAAATLTGWTRNV